MFNPNDFKNANCHICREYKAQSFDEIFDHHKKQLSHSAYREFGYNVVAVLGKGGFTRKPYVQKGWFYGKNIVTTDGDILYAIQAAEETPAANEDYWDATLGRMQLANPATQNAVAKTDTWDQFDNPNGAAIAGSNKVFDATYPKTNDTGDADNTGDAIDAVSYLTSYTTGDFNDGGTTIKNGAIHENASPVAATKLGTHYQITAFNKGSTDTLKLFVNHAMEGI